MRCRHEVDRTTFTDYLARETAIFHDLQTDVTDTLQGNEKRRSIVTIVIARYGRAVFLMRGNRSFVLMPSAKPKRCGGIASRSDGLALQREKPCQ